MALGNADLKTLTMLIVLIVAVLGGCASPQPSVVDLDPLEAKALLDQRSETPLFVLNVHTPYEGSLEGTDATIEEWEHISHHTDKLPKDKKSPILVYCRTGRMSTSAVSQLQELGYEQIYHLKGGMKAWDAAGLPIKDKSFE